MPGPGMGRGPWEPHGSLLGTQCAFPRGSVGWREGAAGRRFCLAAGPLGFPARGGSHAGLLGKVTKPLSPAEKGLRPLVCSYALHGNRRGAGHSGCLAMRGSRPPQSLTDSPGGAASLSQAPPPHSASLLGDLWPRSTPSGLPPALSTPCLGLWGFLWQKRCGQGSQVPVPVELGDLEQDLGLL